VLAAIHDIMVDTPPDLVLSGVNRGNNSAENALYSGTLGGAMEAALQGFDAIALSQYYGPAVANSPDPFSAARQHGAEVIRRIRAADMPESPDYRLFYNVNFPPVEAAQVQGIRAVPQGFRRDMGFGVQPVTAPSGRRFLWVTGAPQQQPTRPGTDAAVNLEGYISVTPMRADLTDHATLDALKVIE
jgi:5'-nucleotidase